MQRLTDVTFYARWALGLLTLPRVFMDKTTLTIFLNLVAHENTSGLSSLVTNYLCILDLIISNADDVKELKYVAVLQEARKSYTEGSTDNYDDLSFGKMMFLDGCFIVQFLHWTYMEKLERMKMKSQDIPVVERDFLLLENQLPVIVLKELAIGVALIL
ncbi:hypothetical protein Vadar_003434 [Vaccinium darrowii]|uniref:Uncharacterized protein n=1 Tax=Vaccinium darrowii TaxID=229202 RepID=A0ACB7YSR7_9ERIC|nr:hypothetical protein Vadar_003434 [Vaccinium darrowii]